MSKAKALRTFYSKKVFQAICCYGIYKQTYSYGGKHTQKKLNPGTPAALANKNTHK